MASSESLPPTTTTGASEADVFAALSDRAEELAGMGEFAGVLVSNDDHVLCSEVYGLADREGGIPMGQWDGVT